MHPLLRNVVVGAVGFLIAAGLIVLGLVRAPNPGLQALAFIAGTVLAAATAAYLVVQAWRWSVIAYRSGLNGRSALIAIGGGVMALVCAGALAATVIMFLLFGGTIF